MRGMRYGRECRAIAQPGPLGGAFQREIAASGWEH
jgi:hypothetical protein